MAENTHTPPAAIDSAAANVGLRFIVLQDVDWGQRISITVPPDLTIGELKTRLTPLCATNPSPQKQRMIYRGRRLNDNETIRSALQSLSVDPELNVIHLMVVEPRSSPTSHQPTSANENTQAQIPPSSNPPVQNPPAGNAPQNGWPPRVFHNVVNATPAVEQADIFQQHMAIHNQHLANLRNGNVGNIQQTNSVPPMPGQAPITVQPGTNPFAHNNGMAGNQNVPNIPQGTMMRVQETIGPNGERTRTITNGNGSILHHEVNHPLHANPVERSASAPGMPGVPIGPGFPPIPRIAHHPMTPSNTFSAMPQAFQFPRPITNTFLHGVNNVAATSSPTVWLLSSPTGPQALLFAPGHGYFSTTQNLSSAATVTGSSGNQVPNQSHASEQTNFGGQSQQDQGQDRVDNGANVHPRAEIVLRPQDQPQPQIPRNIIPRIRNRDGGEIAAFIVQRGWLFLRLYIFIFVLSEPGTWRRIILLGIATLVCFLPRQNPLTNAFNDARRHFDNLIGPPDPAVRRLPRNNEGRPPQAQAVAQPQGDAAGTASNNVSTGQNLMPTPEQHARRLLQEQQERNPSFIRGILRPIEQAVALFLASLIPGVGERHVRAREEARRIVAEEEQRLRLEEVERANQQSPRDGAEVATNGSSGGQSEQNIIDTTSDQYDHNKSGPGEQDDSSSSGVHEPTTASSTGIEATAPNTTGSSSSNSNEGLRQRSGENNQPPPNMVADW